ncbi:hypothetical protein [Streptomyces acidiscabies]|uniref:HTH-like domain-containing protein n=1 Tax=Streptomyces acidiscabies TaxID=42234 RepID=A0AAP6BMI2_9ACTN|nr:hypothetical protein [Streptomyces acidiscabies]MBP5937264.1 hypothetical protein [Streptomyces sp. LBUM 1476]MBZ3914678.1 hypothetical protein [Streptomyces acidiscabies]MDX2967237.1 hypothetical protein [Streptomyces acidiscabies]MDX3020592.1 hypothetical protein [Streptomyces acidiscabies]MDX3795799.1 hypothetical protein [Streptomyces acidiscabies]
MKVAYIDQYEEAFGVQPIYDPSRTDAEIMPSTRYGAYSAPEIHAALLRKGLTLARCTVERLICAASLREVIQALNPRTTCPPRPGLRQVP